MNVNPGGNQPKLRNTTWEGKEQQMNLPDGRPKGMRLVLLERGINTTGMKAADMREMLGACHDFQQQKTILTEYIANRGYKCLYLPKFHCELNPIERVWYQAKKHTKSYCDYTLPTMRKQIPEALNSVTVDNIRKYFQKT